MFDNVLQEEMILEDPLNWFQQVGSQRQRVLQGCLTFTTRSTCRFVPHQFRQDRHFPGLAVRIRSKQQQQKKTKK